jgi:hypothetical protein
MSKKLRRNSIVKNFILSIAVLCAFSLSSALAKDLNVCNNKTSHPLNALTVGIKYNSGQINFADKEVAKLRGQALFVFENASREIAELGLSEADIVKYEKILPQNLMKRLYAVIEVSQMNASSEEKVKTLMQIEGYNCYDYLTTWLTIEVVEIFLGTSCQILPDITCELALDLLRLADTVFFWATVLCYLGIV